MKRVLIFSLAYYPHFSSGAEVAIQEITDRISDIEFHMITLLFDRATPRTERIGNVQVHRVGFGGIYLSKILFIPLAALKARELNRTLHLDALWSMMTYMLLPVVLAKLPVPYVLTLQDGDPYVKVFERWFIRPFAPLLDSGFRNASMVQTISTYLATWPLRRGYRGAIEVVPNGASLSSGQEYSKEELDRLKQEVGKREGDIFLISISRLVHQKGIDVIIRALPLLASNIRLLVVGDGEEKTKLLRLVDELGLMERVIFVGQVDRTMTAKYRKISDIFVLPSRSEGQGISFVSTMISGLPIIATQEGGIADFLFDMRRDRDKPTTGWAVDKDAPDQIADAVKEILAHPDQTKRVVQTARQYAEEHFDWNRIARTMREKVFEPVFDKTAI